MSGTLFALSLAFAFILCGLWRWHVVASLTKWVAVDAKLTKAEIEARAESIRGSSGKYFVPIVEYEYAVDDKIYRSNKFSVHNFSMGLSNDLEGITGGAKSGDIIKARSQVT